MAINFDPSRPIDITLSFDSPQAIAYNLWHKPANGAFILFARGVDEESVQFTSHQHQLPPVPPGTTVKYRMIFAGNPSTPIKGAVVFSQDGVQLSGGTHAETGSTDGDGVAVRSKEVTFDV